MGDVLTFLFAVVFAICYAIAAFAFACAGIVAGGGTALARYGRIWWQSVGPEPLPEPPFGPNAPPAMRGYFFGKGYRDWLQVLHETFSGNLLEARRRWDAGRADAKHLVNGVFPMGMAAGTVALLGPLLTALLAALHGLLLVVLSAASGAVALLLRSLEKATMSVRGFVFTCPRCHERVPLPRYLCPTCGTRHNRLIPSRCGTWRHRCRCGTMLPSLIFLNRGALDSECPACGFSLSRAHTEAAKICVPIVGATSAGKTAFAFGLCHEIREVVAPAQGLSTRFLSPEADRSYRASQAATSRGQAPDKTVERVPHAMDLVLERDGKAHRVVYLYDPAGEAFTDDEYLAQHRFLNYPAGFLLVLDPFAFEPLARQAGTAMLRRVRASATDPDQIATGLLNMLEKNFGLSPKALLKKPLAVVINKIDAAGLDGLIGDAAIELARQSDAKEKLQEARNRIIRSRLIDWDQAAFVQQIESRFGRVGYFAVSALGRSEDASGSPLRPRGVIAPFAWVLAQAGESWRPEAAP